MPSQDSDSSRGYDDDRTIVRGIDVVQKTEEQQAYLIVLNGTTAGKMFKLVVEEAIVGRSAEADVLLTDESVSRNHARLTRIGSSIQISDLGSTNGTYCNGKQIKDYILSDGDKIQIGSHIILKFSYQDNLEEAYLKQLYESATKDGLTEIYNKKYFLDQLRYEFSFAQRKKMPLSLIIFDLDKFKVLNDTYGHLAGDAVLKQISRIVITQIRSHDLFARYGGEEFVIMLRETDERQGAILAERIRRKVEQSKLGYEGISFPVTISVGVASSIRDAVRTPAQLIEKADIALYKAKEGGRNRVELYWETEQGSFAANHNFAMKTQPMKVFKKVGEEDQELPSPEGENRSSS